jgi:hypothetical protein
MTAKVISLAERRLRKAEERPAPEIDEELVDRA